jgi:hypothetical protein
MGKCLEKCLLGRRRIRKNKFKMNLRDTDRDEGGGWNISVPKLRILLAECSK